MKCPSCERPLVCSRCQAEYVPPSQEAYQAAFEAETPLACPKCDALLVCRWCGTPCGPGPAED